MSSEGIERVEELLTRLETSEEASERRTAATELSKLVVDGQLWRGEEPDETAIARVESHLDDEDPLIRGHVAGVLKWALLMGERTGLYGPIIDYPNHESAVNRLLDLASDEEWSIRQTVLEPRFIDELVRIIVAGSSSTETEEQPYEDLHQRLAEILIERLDDSVAVVAKRAGTGLLRDETWKDNTFDHAAGLVLAHPDPSTAVTALIESLCPSVSDTTTSDKKGHSPIHAAGSVLSALATHCPEWLLPHVDALVAALNSSDPAIRTDLIETVTPLLEDAPRAAGSVCLATTGMFALV